MFTRGTTRRSETSQYPEEKKENLDSPSSGERKGNSPNPVYVQACVRCISGVVGFVRCGYRHTRKDRASSLMSLERATGEGKSPVDERSDAFQRVPQVLRDRQTCRNPGGPPPKAKYSLATDSERSTVKEVVKSSPIREVKSP